MQNEDFLLTTPWARRLYHDHAEHMPIVDYHCHLVPQEIYENKRFDNLAQAWLFDNGFGDHYKWRLMRANGTPEEVIRGQDDHARFLAYVSALERAVGNPVYEWSHLELKRFFGIDLVICRVNAEEIWERANALLKTDDFSAKRLIQRMGVETVCTTDDPADYLGWHRRLAEEQDANGFCVLPTFRPDGAMAVDSPGFAAYCAKLSQTSGCEVSDWGSLQEALAHRVQAFHDVGCRLADHGANELHTVFASDGVIDDIVCRALSGEQVDASEVATYQTALTLFLMGEYERRGWTMQVHMNCFRNDSSTGYALVGADAGFDSVGDQPDIIAQLLLLLDRAQALGILPRMILYSLNDRDWLALASLCGSFQGGGAGKMVFGNAWWFNDSFDGIARQLTICAQQGLLGNFPGMVTDSRSFLSYPRHEYFRRVLCCVLGTWVERGQLPEDEDYLGGIVEDICCNNARAMLASDRG